MTGAAFVTAESFWIWFSLVVLAIGLLVVLWNDR
jgi:hypothetical protein